MDTCKQQIIETGKWIMAKGLTWGTSGNISVRDGDKVYVTASGTVLGDLHEDDISIVNIEGVLLDGKKPSKETGMHLEVYRKCPDVNAVLHASPFWTTFAACTDIRIKTNLFIESMYYDEELLHIPYFHAGSKELAEAVSEVADKTHVILMDHHGVLVYDRNLGECRSALEVTDNVCHMNIVARSSGINLTEVPGDVVKDFLEGGYYKKRR
ncbi:MAG: class II aldolase/adducin family protein [Oribacterium sp.]|nr:class II aldolase/adducin family protein [Oribacterium sp.]